MTLKSTPINSRRGSRAKVIFYVTEGGSGMLDPIPMATAIQADLKAVGLSVEIQTFEWNTYLSKVNAGLNKRIWPKWRG